MFRNYKLVSTALFCVRIANNTGITLLSSRGETDTCVHNMAKLLFSPYFDLTLRSLLHSLEFRFNLAFCLVGGDFAFVGDSLSP